MFGSVAVFAAALGLEGAGAPESLTSGAAGFAEPAA